MKKETKIEIFFWLVVAFVFSPRVFLEVYENKLKNSLIPFENNEWTVKDKDGNVIYDKLILPYDLRWKEQKTNRREWIFEKEVNTENLKNIEDLGIVLGRVGDSDQVFFNECLIGSTALNIKTLKEEKWGWGQLRRYPVPEQCITSSSKIKYHVFKWAGPTYGVYGGPLGFGNFSLINEYVKIIDALRFGFQFAFGIGLVFFVSSQYLFIRLLAHRRENYGTFALLSLSIGIFLIMTSVYPFQMFSNHMVLEWILFASGIGSAIFFLKFFQQKFNIGKSKLLLGFYIASTVLYIACLFSGSFDRAYRTYELWHPCFLFTFVAFFIQVVISKKDHLNVYFSKYIFAYAVFVVCCVHDVLVTAIGSSNAYMIGYAFPFFVIVVGLTLSREYSDAYSRVEEQVIQRTHELNLALANVKKLQNLKDDQAKRFSHDMRSPLAALKVLKDIISKNLPEDQGSLLKHAIVRINDLSNTVLPQLTGDEIRESIEFGPVFLWPVIDKIISEKRLEYKNFKDISIDLVVKGKVFEISASCNEIELKRCLSNIINNSVQAQQLNKQLSIIVLIEKVAPFVEITVQDNGKGIPNQIIAKVFDEGFSHDKATGMGIGLSSTKKTIELWQGKLEIHSTESIGTTLAIKLPLSENPKWLQTDLNLKNIDHLVVIDDQPAVFETWKQKLRRDGIEIKTSWIPSIDAWDDSDEKLDKKHTLFLVDQDLASPLQGLDMIQKLQLRPHSVLVTGNDDDLMLRKRALDMNIRILPKSLIHAIDIEI